ncbi:MAG TPA: hypothetical protein VLR90_13780 [Blastocatellia bacterium]|nr:hypothetical protein [Blastocatellia bacterium]
MSIKVDDTGTWPQQVIEELSTPSIRSHFENGQWIDRVYKTPAVQELGELLVESCYESGLIGYHCTKEKHLGYFLQRGLELTYAQRRIDSFLAEYGDRFTPSKLDEIKLKFEEWQNLEDHMAGREGKIWFCLTRRPVISDGTKWFFKYYGGEIIYWPFVEIDHEVESVLAQIGSPVVIELQLDTSQLEFFGDHNLAKSMLSYFGKTVNPLFNLQDIEGFAKCNLSPEQIVRVHPKDEFFNENKMYVISD